MQQPALSTQPPALVADAADQRSQLLGSLLQVSSYLVSVLDPHALSASLVRRAVEALPSFQAGTLWIYEKRPALLKVASIFGLPLEQGLLDQLAQCQLRPGEGHVGAVFQRGEPQLVAGRGANGIDVRLSPRNQALLARSHDALPADAVTVCLPLRVAGETIGVLELVNLGAEPRVRPDDVPLLQTFGNLAAAAIKNAQLYAQTELNRRRLEAFDAVGTAISTAADLDDLLRSVLDVVMGLVKIPAGALLLHDPAQSRLALGAAHGLPPAAAVKLRDQPVVGAPCEEVVRYGQPVLRPLLEERGEGPLLEDELTHGAYLPLLAGGTVVGVLALYGDGTLAEHVDATTLMPLGSQVGFAIANIKLYEDSQLERRKLNTVINSIAEGVVLCDSNGLLTLANQAAMSMLSLAEVPYDQPLADMPDFYGIRDLDGQPLPVESLPLARALSGELFHDYRVLLRGASGRDSVMSFSGAPARADNGDIEGAVVIFRDITASQRLERAKDEFLAVAAHELRSPLAAVRGYADLLLRREQQRGDEDSRDLRGLTVLSQQVTHMLRMVDNLLDVSRLDAGQLDLQIGRVNLVALAGEVLDQQRPSAGNHELILAPGPAELWVQADSLRIRQVLTNLVTNAVRYSPANTSVVVRVAARPAAEGVAEAVVAVSDQGSGIPEEQRGKLFKRYYRGSSRRAEGLGLGLYLSREFVQLHSGEIWVESQEGQGSTFFFSLPIGGEESQAEG
jgi:two-component system phosphate regulon sensor histidine kinase PhoR